MRKRIFAVMASLALILCIAAPVFAEDFSGKDDFEVVFTADEKMVSTFHDKTMDDEIPDFLEPGDTAVFTVNLRNDHAETTDWWMENKVLYSLEDRSNTSRTQGGGYTYNLTYYGPGGERELFSSENVGGDDTSAGVGLHEVTYGLQLSDDQNFFYLDTFANGQGGKVVLTVSLDGETQGNVYQNTLADLAMDFAVELTQEETTKPDETKKEEAATKAAPKETKRTHAKQTGDDANALIFLICFVAAGIMLIMIAVFLVIRRKREKEEHNE